jgi:hypothetical protein
MRRVDIEKKLCLFNYGIIEVKESVSSIVAVDGITVVAPEEAIAEAGVADEKDGGEEDDAADGAGLPLEEEPRQVEDHEHDVGLE